MFRPWNLVNLATLAMLLLSTTPVSSQPASYAPTDSSSATMQHQAYTPPPPEEAHSTTGPTPPAGVLMKNQTAVSAGAVTITVPAYRWTHGCGPTAAGMVIGYWDLQGFPALYPTNNDSLWSEAVKEGIASSVGIKNHYNDYSLPIDDNTNLQADCSTTTGCVPHADNSLADFMYTSRASHGMKYGWSSFGFVSDALEDYVQYINDTQGTNYFANATEYAIYNSSLDTLWSVFTTEIDAGRPVVFLIDTSADGSTDHFITATGYDISDSGQRMYRLNNTWDYNLENWYNFEAIAPGVGWGIYGMTTFSILDPSLLTNKVYLPIISGPPLPRLTLSTVRLNDRPDGYYNNWSNGNNDNQANAGEFIVMSFYLKNDDSKTLSDVEFSLLINDPYINNQPAYDDYYRMSTYFGSMPAGYATTHLAFNFMIARNTPSGHVVNYTINITDSRQNVWSFPGAFMVTGTDTTPPLVYWAGPNGGYYPLGSSVNMNAFILEAGSIMQVTAMPQYPDGSNKAFADMYDNGTNGDYVAGDRSYAIEWTPPAQSDYRVDYYVSDDLGNTKTFTNLSTFTSKAFVPSNNVLLVMDYSSEYYIPYYTNALSAGGYAYDLWSTYYRGPLDTSKLNSYTSGVVIYSMPSSGFLFYSNTGPAIRSGLITYLNNGGQLFITGQDVGYYLRSTDPTFYNTYLHANYVQDDTNLYILNGTVGDPISDGLTIGISGGDGANNQTWPDEINPIAPAVSIFTYNTSGASEEASLLLEPPLMNTPDPLKIDLSQPAGNAELNGIYSSGTSGLRVQEGNYKVVYLSFGFEAINSASARNIVMSRIINWLRQP